MAAKKKDTETKYKAVAKQFIKYNGKHIKPGEEFEVKESSVEELKQFADITIPDNKQDDKQDNNADKEKKIGTGEGEGSGEGDE